MHLIDGFSDFALLGAENSVGGGCGPGGCQMPIKLQQRSVRAAPSEIQDYISGDACANFSVCSCVCRSDNIYPA